MRLSLTQGGLNSSATIDPTEQVGHAPRSAHKKGAIEAPVYTLLLLRQHAAIYNNGAAGSIT